jgi:hypothetical protein
MRFLRGVLFLCLLAGSVVMAYWAQDRGRLTESEFRAKYWQQVEADTMEVQP